MNWQTLFLITANLISGLVFFQMNFFISYLKETRKKLDYHVENFELHGKK